MDIFKFSKGVICGGLIGDCYGYVFEDRKRVQFAQAVDLINRSIAGEDTTQLIYTDDTQMGLAILRSLRAQDGLNPQDLAREFARDYITDGSHRYYGGNIGQIFRSLSTDSYQTPFQFAAEQFGGTGSFGNGGAMRVSPLALYALKKSSLEFEVLVVDVTRLTHTHPLAICGALIQAFAVQHLWEIVSKSTGTQHLDSDAFIDGLMSRLKEVKYSFVDFSQTKWREAYAEYEKRFAQVKSLLNQAFDPSVQEIVNILGNDLRAINSVPTAIYAFLRSLKPIDGIPLESIPLRCLVYVIGFGGDTDTIGTMACSLAGGFCGLGENEECDNSVIPDKILARCERLDVVLDNVKWLGTFLESQQ